jgi:hypothetical protein
MGARQFLFALAGICLLTTPLLAENRGGSGGNHGASHGGGMVGGARGLSGGTGNMRGRSVFTGGQRGSVGWGSFHHDTASAKISPHRFGSTNLPKPNNWRGNVHDFDLASWQGGNWQHVNHNGRFGWWWTVGPDWYFFDAPVYPYPDLYTPLGQPFGWWYWCDTYSEYYPYVTYCPVAWESVMPSD